MVPLNWISAVPLQLTVFLFLILTPAIFTTGLIKNNINKYDPCNNPFISFVH